MTDAIKITGVSLVTLAIILGAVIWAASAKAGPDQSKQPPPGPPSWVRPDGSVDPNARVEIAGPDGKTVLGPDGKPVTVRAADLMAPPPPGPGGPDARPGPVQSSTVIGPHGRPQVVQGTEVKPHRVTPDGK
jgi:hypothetical protein